MRTKNPGVRRDEIEIFTLTNGERDSFGAKTSTPSSLGVFWADVSPMKGKRAIEFGRVLNGQPYEISLNAEDVEVKPGDFCTFRGKKIVFESVINEDGFSLEIIAFDRGKG